MGFSDILKTIIKPQTGFNPFTALSKVSKKTSVPAPPAVNQSFPTNQANPNNRSFSEIANIPPVSGPFSLPGGMSQAPPSSFAKPIAPQTINTQLPTPTPTATPTAAPTTPTPEQSATQTFTTPSGAVVDVNGNLITPPPTSEPSPVSPGGGTEAPPTPAAPTISPETQKAVTDAEIAVAEAGKIGAGEIGTQEDIDKLIEATRKGFLNTSNQPIALDFITGQLKAVESRAINLAEPLEAKLSRLQAARTSALASSKFSLERADKRAASEASSATEERRFQTERKDVKINQDLAQKNFDERQFQSDRTFAENTRQFGEEFALKEKQIEQSKAAADRSFSLSVSKFNEDKRQFGVEAAIDNRKLAIEEAKLSPETNSESLMNFELVNDILDSPDLDAITGFKGPSAFLPKTAIVRNQVKQLRGLLSLESRQKLKGQGQISDFEGRMLAEAATILDTNLSNEDFSTVLKQIRGAFANAAGLAAEVTVSNPKTGKTDTGQLDREEIESAISQGFRISYN